MSVLMRLWLPAVFVCGGLLIAVSTLLTCTATATRACAPPGEIALFVVLALVAFGIVIGLAVFGLIVFAVRGAHSLAVSR